MNCLKCGLTIEEGEARYGLHNACFKAWFNVKDQVEFVSVQRKASSSDLTSEYTPQNTSFFHGKFKKYSADLGGSAYIIKMRQDDAKELPEVEYLCNQIAKFLSVPVAEFFYIDFYGDKSFVTKNFIMPAFAPADLQHIYHFRPDDQHSCIGIINVITKETKRPYDVMTIIRTILFDALIGNHDRHGRNLAFITKATGKVLSPIYDNVSYLALEHGEMLNAHHNPTGKISTSQTFEPSMVDYVKELRGLGYEDNVRNFYHDVNLDRVIEMVDSSFCSELMKKAIKTLIQKRFKELQDEIN